MSNEFSEPEIDPEATPEGYEEGVTAVSRRLAECMRAFTLESSFFLQAVGDRLGMATTDFACLTLLLIEGPLSAGALAERAGLTTGAITGLIDRLERGGWVRRMPDPADRRRVMVEALAARAAALRPLFGPMLREAAEVEQHFDPDERSAIVDFIEQSTEMLALQVSRLRDGLGSDSAPAGAPPGVGAFGPLGVTAPAGGSGAGWTPDSGGSGVHRGRRACRGRLGPALLAPVTASRGPA